MYEVPHPASQAGGVMIILSVPLSETLNQIGSAFRQYEHSASVQVLNESLHAELL